MSPFRPTRCARRPSCAALWLSRCCSRGAGRLFTMSSSAISSSAARPPRLLRLAGGAGPAVPRQLALRGQKTKERLKDLDDRLQVLNHKRDERRGPFYKARVEYFNYIYESRYELQLLLDPVITVHPDEVSFEAFCAR